MHVAIIDYGSGNLHSAAKAFERAAREADSPLEIRVSAEPADVLGAERIVLPGVGAFADCKAGLASIPGMVEALGEAVQEKGKPFLGICVGLQLMASRDSSMASRRGSIGSPARCRPSSRRTAR